MIIKVKKKGKNFCAKKKKKSEQVNLQKLSNFGRIQRNLHIFCAKKKCASFLICFRQLYSWHLRFKASLKKKKMLHHLAFADCMFLHMAPPGALHFSLMMQKTRKRMWCKFFAKIIQWQDEITKTHFIPRFFAL